MRILYICRVFSGFETSLTNRSWQPTGAPTIYKIMESLDRSNNEVYFLMPCKGIGSDYHTQWSTRHDQKISMKGLRLPVNVLASETRYPKWLGRVRGPLTTLRHLWSVFKLAIFFRPELVYVDRSNLLAGALLAYLLGVPVVLRIMGIYPSMWHTVSGNSLTDRLMRWAYRAPFALVICTQDGSGGEFWLPKALRPGVSFHLLVNGRPEPAKEATTDPRLAELPKDQIITLFVGRFETIKGCSEFAEAILTLHARGRRDIHAIMIGTGQLYNSVRSRAHGAGAEAMFTFIERLPHEQIIQAHQRADIYVSLNHLGQLSNANLEAMSAGACMVIPEPQPDRGIDVAIEEWLGPDSAVRIPWDNQIETLANTLCSLAENPTLRSTLRANIKAKASARIQSWDQRVRQELQLISEHIGRPI